MRRARLVLIAAVLLGGVHGAEAQVSGYAIAGLSGFSGFFGSSTSGFHAAGGAEALIRGHAGAGAEFSYTHMSSGEGEFDAWNVGGGVGIWPKDRVGIRLDFRDHVRPDRRGTVHYWSVRAGIVVR